MSLFWLLVWPVCNLTRCYGPAQVRAQPASSRPTVNDGQLDLSRWDPANDSLIPLAGPWYFTWQSWVGLNDVPLSSATRFQLPGWWLADLGWEKRTGYASYALHVHNLPKTVSLEKLAIRSPIFLQGAIKVWLIVPQLNHQSLLIEKGHLTDSTDNLKPQEGTFLASLPPIDLDDFWLIVQTSNYLNLTGGSAEALDFGTFEALQAEATQTLNEAHFLIGIFALLVLFNLSLFIQRPDDRGSLWLAGFAALHLIRFGGTERLLWHYFPSPGLWKYIIHEKVIFAASIAATLCLVEFLYIHYPSRLRVRFRHWIRILTFAWLLTISVISLATMQALMSVAVLYTTGFFAALLWLFLKDFRSLKADDWLQVLSLIIVSGSITHDVLVVSFTKGPYLTHYSLIVFTIIQSQIVGIRFAQTYRQKKRLAVQLQAANVELKDREKARTVFFHNTSHELRTPLNGIIGFVDLILSGNYGPLDPEIKNQLHKVNKLSQSLKFQVNTILDLAKSKRGELGAQASPFALTALKNDLAILAEGLANRAQSVTFTLDYQWNESENPVFCQDREKILTMVRNLLSNAFKFIDPLRPNHVRLEIKEIADRKLQIIVSDTGIGIPIAQQESIFEEFKQVEDDSRRRFEGTGLGLALVKQLALIIGADIKFSSEWQKGTSFSLMIPETEPAYATNNDDIPIGDQRENNIASTIPDTRVLKANQEAKPQGNMANHDHADLAGGARILVVDDNAINCEMISDTLQASGYTVQIVYGGREALYSLETYHPDLILLDLMMPDVSGEDVLRKIRSDTELSSIPVILLTARATTEDRIFGLSMGADDYIAKPIIARELLLRVQNLLERIQIVESLKSLEHHDRLIQLGEMVNDLSHEIKNLHSFGESYPEIFGEKTLHLMRYSDLGHHNWQLLIEGSTATNHQASDLVIPDEYPADVKAHLKSIRWGLGSIGFDIAELMTLWRKVLQLEKPQVVTVEAQLAIVVQFWSMARNSQRTFDLVNRLLDYGRLDSAGGSEQADLKDICDNVISFLHIRFRRAEIKLSMTVPAHEVSGNEIEIQQILTNLLQNAHDALMESKPEQPEIVIDIEKADNLVFLRVMNNGDPISDELKARIFERRFSTKGKKGSGIGLFISRRLALRNQGDLSVETNGGWTIFKLGLRPASDVNQDK
jgi:signal transduction histidine kinase